MLHVICSPDAAGAPPSTISGAAPSSALRSSISWIWSTFSRTAAPSGRRARYSARRFSASSGESSDSSCCIQLLSAAPRGTKFDSRDRSTPAVIGGVGVASAPAAPSSAAGGVAAAAIASAAALEKRGECSVGVGVGSTTSATGAAASCAPTDINTCVSSVAPILRPQRRNSVLRVGPEGGEAALTVSTRWALMVPFSAWMAGIATAVCGVVDRSLISNSSRLGFSGREATPAVGGGEQRRRRHAGLWPAEGSHRRGDAAVEFHGPDSSTRGLLRRTASRCGPPRPPPVGATVTLERRGEQPAHRPADVRGESLDHLFSHSSKLPAAAAAAVAPAPTGLLDLLPTSSRRAGRGAPLRIRSGGGRRRRRRR